MKYFEKNAAGLADISFRSPNESATTRQAASDAGKYINERPTAANKSLRQKYPKSYGAASKKIEAINRLGKRTKGLKIFNKIFSNKALYAASYAMPLTPMPLAANAVSGPITIAAGATVKTGVNGGAYLLRKAFRKIMRKGK